MSAVTRVEVRGGVGLVTLDDRRRRNALTKQIRGELMAAFNLLEARDDVGAIVITGAGSAFCAGADLGDLLTIRPSELGGIYDIFQRVHDLPIPTVAAVNGAAVGAGLNLALACDVRLAAASARFIAGFGRLGLHPGGGNSWMLERLVGPQVAAAMLLFR